jgi:hypothetical protein
MAGIGGLFSIYGKFVLGYNTLWLVGGFVPLMTTLVYNKAKQPE